MKKRNFILSSWLLLVVFSLSSQKNDQNQINKYTSELGLASNFVYQVVQDKKGFIWIGTEEGLNKFDGKNFSSYTTRKGRYCMSHNRAQAVMLSPDGNIWAGTSDGLNIYDYKSDSIIQVKTNTSPLKLAFNDITVLTMSRNNKLTWIGTYGNGLHYYDWEKKKFARFVLPQIHNIPQPLQVMSILEDDNERLWIGTQSNGLYKYDIQLHKLEYCPLKENNLFIQAIYQDSFRRLWIGTAKGCYLYNETTNLFEVVRYPAVLSTASVGAIREDHNGKIWIGSDLFLMNFSVRAFSKSEKFPYQVITQGESSFMLNCPSITSLLADIDNNIWIGTVWGGLNMMQGVQSKFKLYKHEPDLPNSLPKTPITGICTDNVGNLILTTNTRGIYTMNLNTSEFKKLIISKQYSAYNLQAILNDREGNIWLGTFRNGLIELNKNGAEVAIFRFNPANPKSIPNNDVRCIFQCRNQNIFIGTVKGIAIYNPLKKQIDKVLHLRENADVRTIKEDENGLIWIGTYGNGVATYNPANNELNYQPTRYNLTVVYDLLLNKDSVWIATHGQGVYLYTQKGKSGRIYSEDEGLSSNFVRSILRDKNGDIWVGTSNGISKINPKTDEIQNFNNQDGVQPQGLTERCCIQLPNGLMAFGGAIGLNTFNPISVNKNDICPSVVFTRLSIFNQTITPSNDSRNTSPLKQNISITNSIELKYNQSVFTLEFIGLNYNAAQKIQYAYLLEGSDSRWNYIGNQNSVTFRNLEPGKYTLKVKASSPDAVWSDDNITSIDIIIKPPFWKAWWAYLLYITTLGAIFYFIWQFVTLRVRSSNALKIERAKSEKEEELHQEKLQFFTNISHEFRTPLTLLIGPLEKMHREEQDETRKTNIQLMLRNARRLLVMVNQLLDFRKAEKGQMNLRVQYADIIAFIQGIMLSYEELKVTKNIQFEFTHEDAVLMTWFDPEFIDKCLFNLLSNAFKFTPDWGSITVSVLKKTNSDGENYIRISVTDNGKGIFPDELPLIFNQFYKGNVNSKMQAGSGIGLHLTKNLVELHHGTISVESIPDKETKFTIEIPAEQEAYSTTESSEESSITNRQINGNINSVPNIYEFAALDGKNQPEKTKKRILLVEDNEEIRKYVIDILGSNYLVEEAENGIIGLKMASEKEYHLIISDVMMPEMDGIEFCKLLKSNIETDHIPIIMLTAKSSIESRIEGLNVGADSYISKPFHPEHLTIRVSKLIEQRELFKERYSHKISLESIQKPEEKAESPDELFLRKAIAIILDKMIESEFNGDSLAVELHISRMGLHRKVKALTGQSTGEFIRNVRLKKACELLAVPGKNVSEVCYEVGFNSPSYFTTCFTETYKMTPSEYVRNLKR
jgi:Signal transduction histidine kinase